jgi:hypothetical protein
MKRFERPIFMAACFPFHIGLFAQHQPFTLAGGVVVGAAQQVKYLIHA